MFYFVVELKKNNEMFITELKIACQIKCKYRYG